MTLLQRSSIQPIYHHFKSYLCCEVNSAGYYCWLSWTVAGSVTLAYCVAARCGGRECKQWLSGHKPCC